MAIDYEKGIETRREAGARAIGLLACLAELKYIPSWHLKSALEIVEKWDHAFDPQPDAPEVANAD